MSVEEVGENSIFYSATASQFKTILTSFLRVSFLHFFNRTCARLVSPLKCSGQKWLERLEAAALRAFCCLYPDTKSPPLGGNVAAMPTC